MTYRIKSRTIKSFQLLIALALLISCSKEKGSSEIAMPSTVDREIVEKTSLVLLGTAQDAGAPQIGCDKACCRDLFNGKGTERMVVSLGLVDPYDEKTFLFEATPDISRQMNLLSKYRKEDHGQMADGIFLTHGHIGHYSGLMFLGKEAIDAESMPVYAMPRLSAFLENNGPWDQLVHRKNIDLRPLEDEKPLALSDSLQVTPFLVPHRDEYSETVGYRIKGPGKSALFIPDIDKWEKWNKDIVQQIKEVDYAFLDATFYSGEEIGHRDIDQIPHPFIVESLNRFQSLSLEERGKVIFIHFNHTNPALDPDSEAAQTIIEQGFKIGILGDVYPM